MARKVAALLSAFATLSPAELKELPESLRAVLSAAPVQSAASTDEKGALAEKPKKIESAASTDDDSKLHSEASDDEDADKAVESSAVPYEDGEKPAPAPAPHAEPQGEPTPKWAQAMMGMLQKLLEVFESPVASAEDGAHDDPGELEKKPGSEPVMRAHDEPNGGEIAAARRSVRTARRADPGLTSSVQTDALLLALQAREVQSKKSDEEKSVLAWAQAELKDRNVGDLDDFSETVRSHFAQGGKKGVQQLVSTVKLLVPALPSANAHPHAEARVEDESELSVYSHDSKALEIARQVQREWSVRPAHYRSNTLQSWLDSEPELEGKARKSVRG